MAESADLVSQNIMSRGGIEVGELLISVHHKLLARERATGVYSPDTIQAWRETLADHGLDESDYFDSKDPSKKLPWHHIHLNSAIDTTQLAKVWRVFQNRRSVVIVD